MKTSLKLGLLPLTLLLASCASAGGWKGTTKTVLDAGDAVCSVLDSDLASPTVTVACNYVDTADKLSHTFLARVPRTSPLVLAARPPSATSPAASTSSK